MCLDDSDYFLEYCGRIMDNLQIEVFHFPPSHKEWPQKLYSTGFMNCTIVIAVHMLHRPKPKKTLDGSFGQLHFFSGIFVTAHAARLAKWPDKK